MQYLHELAYDIGHDNWIVRHYNKSKIKKAPNDIVLFLTVS